MNKFINILKILPSILLRISHVIVHLFCDIDRCEEDDSE